MRAVKSGRSAKIIIFFFSLELSGLASPATITFEYRRLASHACFPVQFFERRKKGFHVLDGLHSVITSHGTNFNDWIDQYRVWYLKAILAKAKWTAFTSK